MVRFKAEHITIPLENLMFIPFLYQLLLFLVDSVLLVRLKLRDEINYLSGVDGTFMYTDRMET